MLTLARFLLAFGVILLFLGGLIYLATRLNLPFGRLPGDIRLELNNFTCLIGLGTSLVLSIVLTLALNILARWLNK